jgi:hypothetical protein
MVAFSVVLFLVGLNYRGGTILAPIALILIDFATGLDRLCGYHGSCAYLRAADGGAPESNLCSNALILRGT